MEAWIFYEFIKIVTEDEDNNIECADFVPQEIRDELRKIGNEKQN